MIVLKNATLIDGSGAPRRPGDVAVDGERIVEVGSVDAGDHEVVDCTGLCVSPGIVDVHSHADLEALQHRAEKTRQGVTSEVVGNCGLSLFPSRPGARALVPTFGIFGADRELAWPDAGVYFDQLATSGTRTNVAALTGHGTLRAHVKAAAAGPLDARETATAVSTLEACMEQGAIGLSTGLNEVPSCYAGVDELVALCAAVHGYGGIYTSHLRDYKFHFLEAVEEALEIGRRAEVPVQLSHLQAVGQKNWHKMDEVLETIEAASREGADVGIDAYPYVAGSCQLTQLLPTWSLEGGTAGLLRRLADSGTRQRIAEETEAALSNTWDDIVVVNVAGDRGAIGRSIEALAGERDASAVELALDLLEEHGGAVHVVSFNQSEENLRKVLTHPMTSIITDGLHHEGMPHPRTFGTYPTLYGEFVRERQWLSLEEAVHKTTSLPARRFRLAHRGEVAPGYHADLLVFSASEIGTRASYLEPDHPPEGIRHVMVNGQWSVRNGELCESLPGTGLRHAG